MSRSKPRARTTDEEAKRRHHEAQQRAKRATYGLPDAQLHAAHTMPRETIEFIHDIAERGSIGVGTPGQEIAKLIGYGFLEITAANGRDAVAHVTRAGLAVLVLRLAKRLGQ
jgi:hypothetical protein